MKIKVLTITLLLTVALSAQQKRIIRVGGGENPDATKDWPKLSARANLTDDETRAALGALRPGEDLRAPGHE